MKRKANNIEQIEKQREDNQTSSEEKGKISVDRKTEERQTDKNLKERQTLSR